MRLRKGALYRVKDYGTIFRITGFRGKGARRLVEDIVVWSSHPDLPYLVGDRDSVAASWYHMYCEPVSTFKEQLKKLLTD